MFTAYQMPMHRFDFCPLEQGSHFLSISFQGGKLLSVFPKAADCSVAKDVNKSDIKREEGCVSL